MPGSLRIILGDQLSPGISSLKGYDRQHDTVLMVEAPDELADLFYHKKKIALLLSSMRHFAAGLTAEGHAVVYVKLDDPENTGSLRTEIIRAVSKYRPDRIICTSSGQHDVTAEMRSWQDGFEIPVEIRENNLFLYSPEEFKKWIKGRKDGRFASFSNALRKKTRKLTREDIGQRRTAMARSPLSRVEADLITSGVLNIVEECFNDHFGELHPFNLAVTHADAALELQNFVDRDLQYWGDGAVHAQNTAYLSHFNSYLNCVLLTPLAIISAVETANSLGKITDEVTHRFINVVIGFREFTRGIYWQSTLSSDEVTSRAKRNLPSFYLDGQTEMKCMQQCIDRAREDVYVPADEQSIILNNFALLTGVNPEEVKNWYKKALTEGYVLLKGENVKAVSRGIPYAVSGAYIDKKFAYCAGCRYNVKEKHGENACPFNYVYWNFFIDNKKTLENDPRFAFYYRALSGMTISRLIECSMDAHRFIKAMR